MEQAVLRGKINPVCGIFLMKNWLGYKDSYSFEEATETKQYNKPTQTAAEIAERRKAALELPEMERPETLNRYTVSCNGFQEKRGLIK